MSAINKPLSEPVIAMNGNGDFIIAWESGNGSISNIFARKINSRGELVGDEFKVNDIGGFNRNIDIAMNSKGDYIISWENATFNSSSKIYAKKFTEYGINGKELLVNDADFILTGAPGVSINENSDFVVSWIGKNTTPDENKKRYNAVYSQKYKTANLVKSNLAKINLDYEGHYYPVVGIEPEGDYYIAWNYTNGINLSHISNNGDEILTKKVVDGNVDGECTGQNDCSSSHNLVIAKDGKIILSWVSKLDTSGKKAIIAQSFNSGLNFAGSQVRVNITSIVESKRIPVILATDPGNFVGFWQGQEKVTDSKYDNGLFVCVYKDFAPLVQPEKVNIFTSTVSPNYSKRSLAGDNNNNFIVTWTGDALGSTDKSIFYKRYSNTGQIIK